MSNATCPRCFGPGYQGAAAIRCERVGGCLVDRAPDEVREVFLPSSEASRAPPTPRRQGLERVWMASGLGWAAHHPLRLEAVSLWRAMIL